MKGSVDRGGCGQMMMSFIVGGVVGYPNAIDKDYAMTFRYQAACNTTILITLRT